MTKEEIEDIVGRLGASKGYVYQCLSCEGKIAIKTQETQNYRCPCGAKNWKFYGASFTEEEWVKEVENIKTFYTRIRALLDEYMDMSDVAAHIVTLWIIGTYCYEEFNTFPLLFINAVKGSGKTRLLKIIKELAWNGKIQANMREAVLFRTKKQHTLLLDEMERAASKDMDSVRELLNASYKKGAVVERMKEVIKEGKKDYEVQSFDLYSPLAMANIWGMDATLQDRCIVVRLDKSNDISKVKLLEDFDTNPKFLQLKSSISCSLCSLCTCSFEKNPIGTWNNYIKHKNYITTETTETTQSTQTTQSDVNDIIIDGKHIELCEKIDKSGIYGRDLELFFPLIVIAAVMGEECLQKTLIYAKHAFDNKTEEEFADNPDIILLEFLHHNYANSSLVDIPIREIFQKFRLTTNLDQELDIKKFGWQLVRLNVIVRKTRDASGVRVMLDMAKIKKKLERYINNYEDKN